MGGSGSKRYLRLQFELNENFQAKAGETFRDARELIESKQRVNQFTGRPLTEQMDDASPAAIAELLEATQLFIEQGRTFETRNQKGPLVKDAIAAFIEHNS